jgi:hypothetical protein
MPLLDLQQTFWRAMRGELAPEAALPSFAGGTAAFPVDQRLLLYQQMYWGRQVAALAESFPAVEAEVGPPRFERLAIRFISLHPSESPALEWLGRAFPSFLGGLDRSEAGQALADLAELEWCRMAALLAPEMAAVRTLSPEAAGALVPSRLQMHPSLQLRSLRVGALRTWRRHQAPGSGTGADEAGTGPEGGAVPVSIWRDGATVQHHALAADEGAALERALAGAPVGEICGAFLASADPVRRAQEALGAWLADGWVGQIRAPE